MCVLCFRSKRASSESKDEGFLLADSLLSLMMLGIITSILLPALIVLVQYDIKTKEQLEFNRQLFIELKTYEDFDAFKTENEIYIVRQDEICGKSKEELCLRYQE